MRILTDVSATVDPAREPDLINAFHHLLTEDLGVADGDGFRLLGRAAGAELRGCSLVVEELRA